MINIALPKGRLGDSAYKLMSLAGFECDELLTPGRKLIFETSDGTARYFLVKPSDVPIYVERGAADIGVCGSDILKEHMPGVFELADLGIGKCRMCVATPCGYCEDSTRTLRVATKYPETARRFFAHRGRKIDIIKLNGSIELAPILGLCDVIVDIVESGQTLVENELTPRETISEISARLISNKSSYRFKFDEIRALCERIKEMTDD